MAIEKKVLPVAPFRGLYVDGTTVPGGLSQAENIDIMANGWAKRRLPTRTLADAITVKASQGLKELVEFRNSSGTRYLFADLNVSTTMSITAADVTGTTDYEAGTWGNVVTGLTAGTSILPQYAVMQDRLFRVDGTNTQYNFTSNSVYYTTGVTAPSAAPTVAETTGGSLTILGEYNCYYTYVRKVGSYEVESDPSPVSNITLTGSNNAINITIVSSSDASVTHVRLYRTLYGVPDGYAYYDKEIAKATYVATPIQAFTNADASVSTTQLETDNDAPPTAIGMAVAGNRMFYLTKTKLYWSKIEEPEHVPPTWYSGIDPNDGDLGMAVCAMQNYVLAFKRKKTFMYQADSAAVVDGVVGIARHVVSTKIGCIAQNSVQSCGEQNCIVWLSNEGVMKWSGGEIENISKDRVNTIIDSIINTANSEYYVDSAYYNKKYHLLLVERNSAETAITDQRHLVYNFETDSWTEYKYYAADNTTRYYETNLAITTDSNKKDLLLTAILETTTATATYIYQTDYDTTPASTTSTEILDSAGAAGTALDAPRFSCADSSDSVYVVQENPAVVFKVTSAGVKSVLVSTAAFRTAIGLSASYSVESGGYVDDYTNSRFYVMGFSTLGGSTDPVIDWIVQITYAGVVTLINSATLLRPSALLYTGDSIENVLGVNATGTELYYILTTYTSSTVWTNVLHKVSSPGSGQTDTEYYTFPYEISPDLYGFSMYGNNLYFLHNTGISSAATITKFTDITGAASASTINTGLLYATHPTSIIAVSDSLLYVRSDSCVTRFSYAGSWVASSVVSLSGSSALAHSFYSNTAGEFIMAIGDSVRKYDSDFNLITTISPSVTVVLSVSNLVGTAAKENVFIICGYSSDNVYQVYPNGYWDNVADNVIDYFWADSSYADTDMDINGVFGKIVSNYEDLTVPNHKRVRGAYLETMSEYATCGVFALESDFTTNMSIHTDSESTEPSGAVSRAPFASGGQQTWNTNSSFNSGTVENWDTHKLDIGTQGRKFRYSIKFGDIPNATEGEMYIKPPSVEVQIKGKY